MFCAFKPRYQVSVYRTIGPLVWITDKNCILIITKYACYLLLWTVTYFYSFTNDDCLCLTH